MTVSPTVPVFYRQQQDPLLTVEDRVAKDLEIYVARVVVDVAVERYGQGQKP